MMALRAAPYLLVPLDVRDQVQLRMQLMYDNCLHLTMYTSQVHGRIYSCYYKGCLSGNMHRVVFTSLRHFTILSFIGLGWTHWLRRIRGRSGVSS